MSQRVIRYRAIAADLRSRIESSRLGAGQLLPSESELSAEFDASRVTIRKALDELRKDGLVDSRQGFGWFVAADLVQQSLEQLDTIEAQLADSDRVSQREVVSFAFVEANEWVAAQLGAGKVLEVRRRNLVDGRPFGRVTVWCVEDLGSALSRADVESATFHELMPVTLGGATQAISARAAGREDAELLDIPVGSPVLVAERVTSDVDGRPVLASQHLYPGHLTEFVVDLPPSPVSLSPAGLRLLS